MQVYAAPTTDTSVEDPIPRRVELAGVGAVSAGKVMGMLYGTLALLIGVLYGLGIGAVSVGAAVSEGDPTALLGLVLAVAVAVGVPILYGTMGMIAGVIMAAIYNFAAGRVGGLELKIREA